MNIIHFSKVPQSDLPPKATASTYIACVKVGSVSDCAKELIELISKTSWIDQLDPVAKLSYEKTSLRTINNLVNLFQTVQNKVTEDFGEYMVSVSSGYCLDEQANHQILPLSELWKEKLGNNHGFDFHTVSTQDKFSFGEAKYVSSGNSYGPAAKQTLRFIEEEKDKVDAVHLEKLSSEDALNNLLNGRRGFTVGFSVNSPDYLKILGNAVKNKYVQQLSLQCDELYIIGVQV